MCSSDLSGTVEATQSATLTVDGPVTAAVNVSSGTASVTAAGPIQGAIKADKGAAVQTLDALSGTVSSAHGQVQILAYGNVTGDVSGDAGVSILAWKDVNGTDTSADGSVTVFAGGDDSGDVEAGANAKVDTLGNVTAAAVVNAGNLAQSGPNGGPYTAAVDTVGNEAGKVHSSDDVVVSSVGDVSGTIVADAGQVMVASGGVASATVTGATDVRVYADSISSSTYTATAGGVGLAALHDATATLVAQTGAAIGAGGNVNATVTVKSDGGNATVSGLGNVTATVKASKGAVTIFAGGDANVSIGGSGGTDGVPAAADVAAFGNVQGTVFAIGDANVSAWGALSNLTVTTTGNLGTASLFAKGAINATVTAGDSLSVAGLADVAGTYTALALAAQSGNAEVDALGNVSSTVKAVNDVSVSAGGSVSGTVLSTGSVAAAGVPARAGSADVTAGQDVSADVEATLGTASVAAIAGSVSKVTAAGQDATVFAGKSVTGDVSAENGSATVSTLGSTTGGVDAGLDATVTADKTCGSAVTAGRNATVSADGVSGTTTAGANADVTSGHDVSGAVTAGTDPNTYGGGSATVSALGDVSAAVTAYTDASVSADGNLSAAVTATHGSATVLTGKDVTAPVDAGTSASVTALGNVTGDTTASTDAAANGYGDASVTAVGNLQAKVTAGTHGSADVVAGQNAQGSFSAGNDVTVSAMGNVNGTVTAGGVANVTSLGNVNLSLTAGTNRQSQYTTAATVFAWGNLTGDVTTQSGDVNITACGDESATVDSAGGATVAAFGKLGGGVTAVGSVNATGAGYANIQINAGNNASVSAVDALRVTGHAGTGPSGGSFTIDGVDAVYAQVTAQGDVDVTAGSDLSGSGESTAGDVDAVTGGTSTFDAKSDQGDASVAALGSLAGNITAAGTATGDTWQEVSALLISGGQGVELSALDGGSAHATSDHGGVEAFAGGTLSLQVQCAGDISAGSAGNLTLSATTAGSIDAIALLNLGGDLGAGAGGSVEALALGNESADISAGGDVTVFGGTGVGGGVSAGGDLTAVSYGDLAAEPGFSAWHDLWAYAAGNLGGVFHAGNAVRALAADGSVDAIVTANTICQVVAWGDVKVTETATTSTGGADAGGTANVSQSAPSTGAVTQHDGRFAGLTPPVLGDVGQSALRAELSGLRAQGRQIAQQLAQDAAAVAQQVALARTSAQQVHAAAAGEFATAVTQTVQALAAADTQAGIVLAQAQAADQKALSDANTALSKAVAQVNAQAASDDQSDQASLAAAKKTVADAQAQLTAAAAQDRQIASTLGSEVAKAVAVQKQLFDVGRKVRVVDWDSALVHLFRAVVDQNAREATPSFGGFSASQWLAILLSAHPNSVGEVALTFLQLGADAANGAQEAAIEAINDALKYSGAKYAGSLFGVNLQLTQASDWSHNLFTNGEPAWFHAASKFVGGQALLALLTVGASESGLFCKLTGGGCFTGDTGVVTGYNPDGTYATTPIDQIKVGDYVLSRNQDDPTGPAQEEEVTGVERHEVYALQEVTVRGTDGKTETIRTTAGHEFYVVGSGWTEAGVLSVGEQVELPDGTYATVFGNAVEAVPGGVAVYNLTVDGDHTYFVDDGGSAVWVHNSCTADSRKLRNSLKAAGERFRRGQQAAHIVP